MQMQSQSDYVCQSKNCEGVVYIHLSSSMPINPYNILLTLDISIDVFVFDDVQCTHAYGLSLALQ